jgi:hypothetical protein
MASRAELYEYHARECDLAAGRTDNPERREMFLKLAREWRLAVANLVKSTRRSIGGTRIVHLFWAARFAIILRPLVENSSNSLR